MTIESLEYNQEVNNAWNFIWEDVTSGNTSEEINQAMDKIDFAINDYLKIKEQIKGWEMKLDNIINDILSVEPGGIVPDLDDISETLEDLSHEMMAINI
jgi:hypothetical protein